MGAVKHQMMVAEDGLVALGVDARVAHCVVWSYDPLTDKPIGTRRRLACLETALMQINAPREQSSPARRTYPHSIKVWPPAAIKLGTGVPSNRRKRWTAAYIKKYL